MQEKPKLSPEETKKQIEELRIKNKAKREVLALVLPTSSCMM